MTPSARIGLVLHPGGTPIPAAGKVVRWAQSHGAEVRIDAKDAERCPSEGVRLVAPEELARGADLLVSVGGDGTMLGALRLAARDPVPVLGVNAGRLGFLVEVEPDDLDAALDRIVRKDYTVEAHPAAFLSDGSREMVAFNDIALARVPGAGLVSAALTIGGRAGGRYRCDAIVIATPNGSTAYSYAAGGPLVSPNLDAVIITAVAPLAGIARPLVTSATEMVQLHLLDDSGSPSLELDGIATRRAEPGETFEIQLRADAGQVVRLDPERYERRRAVKLSLLDLPFLPDEMRDLLPPST
ncbi:MAG TPA: NAD(+)/NADH kinase [Thermoleophilaceae bacterium]